MIPTTLTDKAGDLAREHNRLARELYAEASLALGDGNLHVRDCLAEQADLHEVTAATIYDLVHEIALTAHRVYR